jgi:hypothetical protein
MSRRANKNEVAIAADEAQQRSLTTGEVLREKNLCPLVIVRARDSGVHVGWLAEYHDGDAMLLDARRLWGWGGGPRTLNEVAVDGAPQAKLSQPIKAIAILDACELVQVETSAAAASLTTSRWE